MDWKYLFGLILLNSITFTLAKQFNLRAQTRRDSDGSQEEDSSDNNKQQQESEKEDDSDDDNNDVVYEGVLAMGDSGEKSEEIPPGQTLIRPDQTMLQSSAAYPKKTLQNSLVYGGSDIINRHPTDLLNTGFRRHNRNLEEALNVILDAVKRIDHDERKKSYSDYMLYLQKSPSNIQFNSRRASRNDSSDSDSSSSSTEQEENIGNPYTIYKNKYKQNWPWNFEMDGDHMNLNPNGPEFTASWGPSGSDLFQARKWWYFNQDDFVPFR